MDILGGLETTQGAGVVLNYTTSHAYASLVSSPNSLIRVNLAFVAC